MSAPKPRGRPKKQPASLPQPDPVSLEESKEATDNMEITDNAPQEENAALSTKKPRGRPKKQPVPQEEVPVVEETPEVIREHADSQVTKAPPSPVSEKPESDDWLDNKFVQGAFLALGVSILIYDGMKAKLTTFIKKLRPSEKEAEEK